MDQVLKDTIVENQRLKTQIQVLKNSAIKIRDDLLGREDNEVSQAAFEELQICIDATPEYVVSALAANAVIDFSQWLEVHMRDIASSYLRALDEHLAKTSANDETMQ